MSREHLIKEARAHLLGLNADEILEVMKEVFNMKGYRAGASLLVRLSPPIKETTDDCNDSHASRGPATE